MSSPQPDEEPSPRPAQDAEPRACSDDEARGARSTPDLARGSTSNTVQRDAMGRRVRGRGAITRSSTVLMGEGRSARFDSFGGTQSGRGAAQSEQGWVIIVSGVHEEAQEEDVQDRFREFGSIRNLHLNLDRRTGYVKGYALIVYASRQDAQGAIDEMDGKRLMGQRVAVDWAFHSGPIRGGAGARGPPSRGRGDRD